MDKFLDILNSIWNFFNHPVWFPVILAMVSIVFFVVLFHRANRVIDKHREEVQRKIVNDAYGDYISHKYCFQRPDKRKVDK